MILPAHDVISKRQPRKPASKPTAASKGSTPSPALTNGDNLTLRRRTFETQRAGDRRVDSRSLTFEKENRGRPRRTCKLVK